MATTRPERAVIDAASALLLKRLTPLTEDPFEQELASALELWNSAQLKKKCRAKEKALLDPAKEIERLFDDPATIKRLLLSFEMSRSNNKIPNTVKLSIIKKLNSADKAALKSSISAYLDKHQGKHENYFFRIMNGYLAKKKELEDPASMWMG